MIRVLHVFSVMNRGGAETMLMNLYRKMDFNIVQFDFIVHTKKKGEYDDEIKSLGGKIFYLPFFYGYNLFGYQRAWRSFFRTHPEYSIIHVHYFTIAGAILPIARECNIAVRIVHCHTAVDSLPFLRYLRFYILRPFAIRNATERFACGNDAGIFFYKKNNFIVLNNSIDAEAFRFNSSLRTNIRHYWELNDKFVIGHVGSFTMVKNHNYIIKIFKKIIETNKNAILFLVGDGPLQHDIRDMVVRLGLQEKVIFAGVRANVSELLQAFDVFLFPSLHEGLPVVLIEAQAAGLKVIASDTISKEANITDLVQNISLEASPEEWSEAVNCYADGYHRKDTFDQIVKAGYDVHTTVKWLEKFYLNVLK